jgi:diacylglycerol kinase (ATP)
MAAKYVIEAGGLVDKIQFIINPVAGGGKASDLVPKIEQFMQNVEAESSIAITEKPKDAIGLTKDALKEGYEKIVAVGGDGTVNEVALGIIEAGHGRLGIVPSGTGNDLARSLGIPFSLEQALSIVLAGRQKKIDIGAVNGRLFLNIASIGFDAAVVKTTERIKKWLKSGLAYFVGVLVTLIGFKDIKVRLQIDGKTVDKDVLLVAVGNGKYYGGGLKVLPMAEVEDGYFHVCVVNKMSKCQFLFFLPTIVQGRHVNITKHVEVYKTKQVRVSLADKAYVNTDGEIRVAEEEQLFTIESQILPVFIPDQAGLKQKLS